MSWIGGKKALRSIILKRFPDSYKKYVEVFGGGGWVLFHKPPRNDFEVYNDFNPNLANLYRCVRDNKEELIEELRYVLNSREDFNRIKELFKTNAEMTDVQRAAKFYQLIRYSYASGCTSYGCQPHNMWSNFKPINEAHRRLKDTLIENKDFADCIKHYDDPVTFFYCDPPYFATENYYSDVGFTSADHQRLFDSLINIQGNFLLSYNDCPEIRALYEKPNIYIESVKRLNNLAQRYDSGSEYKELLISNYDTSKLAKKYTQMTFLNSEEETTQDDDRK